METPAMKSYQSSDNKTEQVQLPILEKLISFKDPRTLAAENWFALLLEIGVYCILLLAFRNAKRRGTEKLFLLVTAWCATLGLELLQQVPNPGFQLWWYHSGVVNIFKYSVPAFIPSFVSVVYYYTDYMTRDMKLSLLAQSMVNAAFATLLMFPCLVLAPKLLLIFFHFDEPLFYDRIFNVPFIQITYLFLLFFHIKHCFVPNFEKIEFTERYFFGYLKCSIQTGIAAMLFSIVETYILYLVFKLLLNHNSAFCLIFAVLVLTYLANIDIAHAVQEGFTRCGISETLKRKEYIYMVGFFVVVLLVPVLVKTENLKSHGERLELGPCNENHTILNADPLGTTRQRYVCAKAIGKFDFDFHCLPYSEIEPLKVKKEYTICGTPFENFSQWFNIFVPYSLVCLIMSYFLSSISLKTVEVADKMVYYEKVD